MNTFIGLCAYCLESRQFGSQEARDNWENEHLCPEPLDRFTQDRIAAGLQDD